MSSYRKWLAVALVGSAVVTSIIVAIVLWSEGIASREDRAEYLAGAWTDIHGLWNGYLLGVEYTDAEGRILSSWRFQSLRLYQTGDLPSADFEAAWDAPVNAEAAAKRWWGFCFRLRWGKVAGTDTNVVAVTGPGTAWAPLREREVEVPGHLNHFLSFVFANRAVRAPLKSFPQDAIVLIEVAHSGIHWMAPGDLDVREVPPDITRGLDGDGVFVVFVDGAVWYLDRNVPLEDLKKFFTLEGAKQHDRDVLLRPYATVYHEPILPQLGY